MFEDLIVPFATGIIGFGLATIFEFVVLWLVLRDRLIFPLQRMFTRGGERIHVVYHPGSGTEKEFYFSEKTAVDDAIYTPWDKEKANGYAYIPTNSRDATNMPVVHIFEGIPYTVDINARHEKVSVPKLGEDGKPILEDEKQVMVEQWVEIIGASYSDRKSSKLSSTNKNTMYSLGRASALTDLFDELKANPYLFYAAVGALICSLLALVMSYMVYSQIHDLTPTLMAMNQNSAAILTLVKEQAVAQGSTLAAGT